MEYIESGISINHAGLVPDHRDRWAGELQHLTEDFHAEGLVHGDLRDTNIICKEDCMMLIEFDWGGKDGEVFYPTAHLNDELRQGRVSDDLRITKEDDRRVLRKTLAKLMDIRG
jgi:Ser/Thr protein kinase RdoA (MazF antagonist)